MIEKGAQIGVECWVSRDVEIAGSVTLGDYSYVNAGSIIASGAVGKFCSIGYYSQIGMPAHPTAYIGTSPRTYGTRNVFGIPALWNDYPAPPAIGNDVWVGSMALILQGVRVNDGAVVSGGAVVTKDVPPYCIVGGVPARVIRQRFEDEVVEALLRLRWWDLPRSELAELAEVFALAEGGPAELARRARK
jgi:acetyltransferase-like isoleucine patch superfamily enzyme